MARCYNYTYGYYYNCYGSGWNNYGRWILLGAIILFALVVFFLFSCLSARRRRKLGYQPYRGTAWTLGNNNHGQAQYNTRPPQEQQSYYNNNNTAAPPYQPNNGSAAGYYGQPSDVQQPGATYSGYNSGHAQYAPPPGKPPGQV